VAKTAVAGATSLFCVAEADDGEVEILFSFPRLEEKRPDGLVLFNELWLILHKEIHARLGLEESLQIFFSVKSVEIFSPHLGLLRREFLDVLPKDEWIRTVSNGVALSFTHTFLKS